jgi:opacity protein-like surface antigen
MHAHNLLRFLSATLGCACLLQFTVRAETDEPITANSSDSDIYLRVSAGPQHRMRASDSAGSTTFKTGYVIDAALGYLVRSHHFEAEIASFNNRCKTTDPAGDAIGVEPSSGNVDVDTLMANYAYDIPLGHSRAALYLGGGIGMCRVSINGLTTPSLRTLPAEWGGPVVVYAKSDWASAYQLRAGVTFRPSPRLNILLGYRLMESSTLDINLTDGSTIHPDARIHALEAAAQVRF